MAEEIRTETAEVTDPGKRATELSDLRQLHDNLVDEFQKRFWESGAENKRFRKGDHWSESEKGEIDDQDLIAYSLALAGTKITINISQQMANRQEFRCLGRGLEDEVNAEIKTYLMKFVDDDNDLEHVESDVYADGIGKKYGVIKRYTDYSRSVKGRVVLKRLPYNQVMWDINCTDYNVPKFAKFMQEFDYFTREELKIMYPNKTDIIEKIEDGKWSGKSDSNNPKDWYRVDRGLKLLKRAIHYERRYKTVYARYMSDGTVQMSDNPSMNNEADNQEESYSFKSRKYTSENPEDRKFKIESFENINEVTVVREIPRIKEYIVAIVFTCDMSEELDRFELGIIDGNGKFISSDMHCLHPYYSFFDDGDVICLMDYLKQPQKFLDRLTMQIDKSMSKMIKTSYTTMKELLAQETIDDWENVSAELASGGANVSVKSHDAIRAIQAGIITPELFTMWQFVYKVLEDISGGRNNAGLKESANESGVAVEQRKEAAYALSFLYIDNLRRWKKTLGEGIMENLDEVYGYDKKATFRILGDSLSKEVIEILQTQNIYEGSGMPYGYGYINLENIKKPLGETKVDIIISRAASTPLQKEKKLNQLMGWYAMKAKNGEKTPPISLMFPYMDIDPTVKSSIMKWEKEMEAKQAAMIDLEKKKLEFQGNMQIAKSVTDAGKALGIKHENNSGQESPGAMPTKFPDKIYG